MNRCYNYKFVILLILPLFLFALGVLFLIFAYQVFWIGLLTVAMGLVIIIVSIFTEPIYYIIDSQGIVIHSCFRENTYVWWDISSINIREDYMFSRHVIGWFIKDYVIWRKNSREDGNRMNRIAKTKKTAKLLNEFCPKHLIHK